jgi:hypothetical protein
LKPAAVAAGLLRPEEAWKKPGKPESWVSFHTLADPGFTLRTYVHLMDEGLGDADFLDGVVALGETRG